MLRERLLRKSRKCKSDYYDKNWLHSNHVAINRDLDKVTKEIIQELKLKKKDGDTKNKDWGRFGKLFLKNN